MNALIIPVYKNEDSIPELLSTLESMYTDLGEELTITFVVDGSPDKCHELLMHSLPGARFPSKLFLHSRNFGSFAAIRTGLLHTEAEYYSVMAADMQEPPSLIHDFFKILRSNGADLVLGARDGRKDPWSSIFLSSLFWNFYRCYIVKEIPKGGVDIFGCNRQVRDKVLEFREARSSLVAQLMWVGFRRKVILYHRLQRRKGKSAWTFTKKMDYLLDSIFSFTDLPIKLLMNIGALGTIISFIVGLTAVIARLTNSTQVSGYTALMIAIMFFGAMNLLGLGIIGSYAQRGYENTKMRPLAIVADKQVYKGENRL